MLKSSRLVLALGTLLGASVAVLPATSFAATSITHSTDTVSATINGYLSFTEVSHAYGTTTTYDETNKSYTGTFNLMDSTNNFGTTTYEVTCNYNTTKTPYVLDVNDVDNDATTDKLVAGAVSDGNGGYYYSSYVNTNCANGWIVKAQASTYDQTTNAATMEPENPSTNSFKIKSTTAALSGTSANWKLKTAAVSGTQNATVAPYVNNSESKNYADFDVVPGSTAAPVVTGNTFTGTNNATYLGPQQFTVTYGFTAGMDAVADTYTGEITYTLYVNAAS